MQKLLLKVSQGEIFLPISKRTPDYCKTPQIVIMPIFYEGHCTRSNTQESCTNSVLLHSTHFQFVHFSSSRFGVAA